MVTDWLLALWLANSVEDFGFRSRDTHLAIIASARAAKDRWMKGRVFGGVPGKKVPPGSACLQNREARLFLCIDSFHQRQRRIRWRRGEERRGHTAATAKPVIIWLEKNALSNSRKEEAVLTICPM